MSTYTVEFNTTFQATSPEAAATIVAEGLRQNAYSRLTLTVTNTETGDVFEYDVPMQTNEEINYGIF